MMNVPFYISYKLLRAGFDKFNVRTGSCLKCFAWFVMIFYSILIVLNTLIVLSSWANASRYYFMY